MLYLMMQSSAEGSSARPQATFSKMVLSTERMASKLARYSRQARNASKLSSNSTTKKDTLVSTTRSPPSPNVFGGPTSSKTLKNTSRTAKPASYKPDPHIKSQQDLSQSKDSLIDGKSIWSALFLSLLEENDSLQLQLKDSHVGQKQQLSLRRQELKLRTSSTLTFIVAMVAPDTFNQITVWSSRTK